MTDWQAGSRERETPRLYACLVLSCPVLFPPSLSDLDPDPARRRQAPWGSLECSSDRGSRCWLADYRWLAGCGCPGNPGNSLLQPLEPVEIGRGRVRAF